MVQQNHNLAKDPYDISRLAMRLLGKYHIDSLSVHEALALISSAFKFQFAGLYRRSDGNWSLKYALHNGFYYQDPITTRFFGLKPNLLFSQTQMRIIDYNQFHNFIRNESAFVLKRSARFFLLPFRLMAAGQWVLVCVLQKQHKTWTEQDSAHLALLTQNLVSILADNNGINNKAFVPLGELQHVMRNGLNAIRMLVHGLFKEKGEMGQHLIYKYHFERQIEEMNKMMDNLPDQ